jgi:repressor LexA
VQHLVEKGLLRKGWNRSRSLEPVPPAGPGPVALPHAGVVAAGVPIEAIEDQETIGVPPDLVPPRAESFVLRVRGDSMIDEQIRDGDFVVVERCSEARDGETVVALIRGHEATLKKLQRRGAKVRLVPANASMAPIELPARDVRIQGVVRGLLRRY